MAREFFSDLPNTTTPLTASRLNGLLDGEEAMGSIVVDDVNCKNMFDKGSFVAGDRKDAQPTIRISSRQVLYLEPGTYTFSTDLDTSVYRYEINTISSPAPVSSYDVLYGSGWKTTSTLTITIDNSTKGYFNLGVARINNSSLTISDISSANFQLEKGSTATNYVSYNQPVKKTSIGVKESCTFYADDFKCRNLFTSAMQLGSLNNDTGATATSTDAIRTANFVEVEPNTTYTVSNDKQYHIYIYEYSSPSSSGFIKYTGSNTDAYKGKSTITTTSTTKYIKIRTVVSNVENDLTSKWQLEVGSEATPYTEYKQFDYAPVLLWTNSSTSSSFAGQNVTLSDNIANYKYYEVIYQRSTTANYTQSTGKIIVGNSGILQQLTAFAQKREISIASTTATFTDAVYYATYGNSTTTNSNTIIIPLQILGYK